MNQIPPITKNAIATTMAVSVLIWMARKVVMTGPSTQMISCAEASRENNGVSCLEFTILG